jgi:hypothetical protein
MYVDPRVCSYCEYGFFVVLRESGIKDVGKFANSGSDIQPIVSWRMGSNRQ